MLLSGLACVLPASAAKRYVQVTNPYQLTDGPQYAIGAVYNVDAFKNNGVLQPRFLGLNDANKAVLTAKTYDGTFDDSMLWSLTPDNNYTCGKTNTDHNGGNPGLVFHVGKVIDGVEKYIVQASGDNAIASSGLKTLNLSDQANQYSATEFVALPEQSEFAGEQLFALCVGWTNTVFQAVRVVNSAGEFNRLSNPDTQTVVYKYGAYTGMHRVYLEIDESNLLPAAKALMKGCVYEEAEKWTAHFQDRSYAEALKAALVEAVYEAVSLNDIEYTYDNVENQITCDYFKPIVRAKVTEVLDSWLNGRIVKLQNQGSMHYMAGHPADGINLGTCEEITAASSWGLKKSGENWLIKNYDQHFVSGGENISVSYDESQATPVKLVANDDYTVSIVLASDATKLLRAAGDDAIRAAEWSTTDDAYAHWKFYGINYTVQFAARQAEKERLQSVIDTYNTHGLFRSDEYEAIKAGLQAIDCTEPEANQEKVAKLEEVSIALANVIPDMWESLDRQYLAMQFERRNGIVTVKEDLAHIGTANSTATAKSIWQLQYAGNEQFRFYNPYTHKYIAYDKTEGSTNKSQPLAVADPESAELFKIVIYNGTGIQASATPAVVLVGVSLSQENVLHKNNNNDTDLMRWNNGDLGSALHFLRTSGELYAKLSNIPTSVESVLIPNTGTNFRDAISVAVTVVNNTDIDDYLENHVKYGYKYEDFKSVVGVGTLDGVEFGAFITLTSYPAAISHIKLHYTTKVDNGLTVLGVLNPDNAPAGYVDDTTEANSIWFYRGGKLVNYEEGFYVDLAKNGVGNNHFSCCSVVNDNNGTAVKFVNGKNAGTSQLIVGTNDNIHIHQPAGRQYVVANRCTGTGFRDENEHDFNVALVSELPVSVHSDGWGSFSSPITYSIPAATGCTFFGAKLEDESLSLHELAAGTKLAGGTSVLFAGPAGQTVRMPLNYCEEGNAEYTGFGGTHIAAPHTESYGMKTFAKTAPAAAESGISTLSVDPSAVVSLSAVGDAKPVHSMTLTVPESDTDINNDGSAYTLRVGELTTGIRQIVVNRLDGTHTIYDLQGRRLSEPVKGSVNIIDGKKILVK